MRLFAASLATETNFFSPIPTSLEAYKNCVFMRPGEHPDDKPAFGTEPLWVARRRAAHENFTLIEGSCFAAPPSGPTNRDAYEFMRDEILGQVKAALPLDGVLLGLHGAMAAHGYDDVEGDILEQVRAIVGPKCVIGVELDPHCHLTVKRVRLADITVLYKEYPHTDTVDCAEDLLDLVLRTIRGQIEPVVSLYDCRLLQFTPTTAQPMRGFVDRVKELERDPGVLSISIGHGFSPADTPEVGARILVTMDNDKAKGDALAVGLGEEFVALRGKVEPKSNSIDAAIDMALAADGSPVVIADAGDNAGAGMASDNTDVLRRLVERNVQGAVVGPLWDPIAVELCFDAGVGAKIPLRFGGKTGPASGAPFDATVTVVGLKRDAWQSAPWEPMTSALGDCAAVRVGAVEVVLNCRRTQALGLELFSNVNIDPVSKKIVVLKSTAHFMTAWGPVAKKVIYVDSGGSLDPRTRPYTRVQRPIWPLDKEFEPGLLL